MPGVMQAPGGCNCEGYSILCYGCNNGALDNYAIDVYDTSGGTLLFSLTTDSTGHISLRAGTYWLQSHDGRYAGPSITVSSNATVTLTPASGYACIVGCPFPISKTLHFTDSNGTWTLTWASASGWFGCGTNPSVPSCIVSLGQPTCGQQGNPAAASIVYSIQVNGGAPSIKYCKFSIGGGNYLNYHGDGTDTASCSGGVLACNAWPSCASYISTQIAAGSVTSSSCSPFSVSGTLPAGGPPYDPAAGSWTYTE